MQQPNSVANMFDHLASAMRPYTELMELSVIWNDGKRFTKGDKVIVITDTPSCKTYLHKDPLCPTHTIIKCMGTLQNTRFQIHLENLDTNETKIITL